MKIVRLFLCVALPLGMVGCGQQHVFTAPEAGIQQTDWPGDTLQTEAGGLGIRVQLFKPSNIFGARIRIENKGTEEVSLQVGKIEMEMPSGDLVNAMEPDQAAKFINDSNQGMMFVMAGFQGQAALQEVSARARAEMLESGTIPPGKSRSGLLYFRKVPAEAKLNLAPALLSKSRPIDVPAFLIVAH